MLLALDVGNTNTVLGLFKLAEGTPAELVANWRITTSRNYTADEFGVLLRNLLHCAGWRLEQ